MSAAIALEIHICDQRRSYDVKFYGPNAENHALKFLEDKGMTHAFWMIEDQPIDPKYTRLMEVLFPTCEHGMSADLCMGPGHYMSADQERAMGWD